ncbi:MAG: hypothetical protein PHO20_03365 [Candidatus Peribacteraceae bacterium]|nr:hypothetical protein [Candidatus Peribacteraceae bacterium]MDD5739781.1 hypothetical protein [Candidatus Peribacteraceae bacterium]
MPNEEAIILVDQLSEEQLADAYAILKAGDSKEKSVLRSIGKRGARLERGWKEKVCQRFREKIQRSLAEQPGHAQG